jgi:hypothetical protein
MKKIHSVVSTAAIAASAFVSQSAMASSHREAPAIAEDPMADNTDVYAFISPNDSSKIVFVANYVPLLLPASGPNFYRFGDSVRYQIRVDNDGDAKPDISYSWTFNTTISNGDTFLYNTGAIDSLNDSDLNVKQTYTLRRINEKTGNATIIASDVPVAPWNVGKRSFPGNSYETVARQAIKTTGGVKMFAGPRDEPFFVDLHVFDLLGVGGAPTTDGVNVMSLVLEVPIADVAKGGTRPAAGDTSQKSVIGVYARAERQQLRIVLDAGDFDLGGYVQVSRLGWPLVNEVIVPLGDKNKYNRSNPKNDVGNFGAYILDPEVPKLLDAVLMTDCADPGPDGRTDIVGLLSPNGTTAADLLRINITQGQPAAASIFPNGRGLTDDVTDTLLTVACNSESGAVISDGVDANDLAFTADFPYLASPHSGNP